MSRVADPRAGTTVQVKGSPGATMSESARNILFTSLILCCAFERGVAQVVIPPARPSAPSTGDTWQNILTRQATPGAAPSTIMHPSSCEASVQGPDSLAIVSDDKSFGDVFIASHNEVLGVDWTMIDPVLPRDTLRAALANASCMSSYSAPELILRAGPYYVLVGGLTETSDDEGYFGPDEYFANSEHPLRVVTSDGRLDRVVLRHACKEPNGPCEWHVSGHTEYVDSLRAARHLEDSLRSAQATRQRTAANRARTARIRRYGWPQETTETVLARRIQVGMNPTMVREAWGAPKAINRTTTGNAIREQWVYGPGHYVYFENGIVLAIDQAITAP